jgi:hypothetical protein
VRCARKPETTTADSVCASPALSASSDGMITSLSGCGAIGDVGIIAAEPSHPRPSLGQRSVALYFTPRRAILVPIARLDIFAKRRWVLSVTSAEVTTIPSIYVLGDWNVCGLHHELPNIDHGCFAQASATFLNR